MANSLLHEPQKLIIDTDPGIDDSIAIMMAFESSELKIIGMTTIFGCTSEVVGAISIDCTRGLSSPSHWSPSS
ncbi:hypothetical protein AAHE18_12G153600 [Arachis hypogaea]